jgi:hypothetical protein
MDLVAPGPAGADLAALMRAGGAVVDGRLAVPATLAAPTQLGVELLQHLIGLGVPLLVETPARRSPGASCLGGG